MKNILSGAVAAIALVAISAPAAAQTNERHYASPLFGGTTITNPGFFGTVAGELGVALQLGTRYTAQADAPVTPSKQHQPSRSISG